jgi:Nicotinate-nucleotide pyrophosphorylase
MIDTEKLIDDLIDLSFREDIGDGDHTTLCCIPADATGASKLLIKQEGILAGVEAAKKIFARFDATLKVEVFMQYTDQLVRFPLRYKFFFLEPLWCTFLAAKILQAKRNTKQIFRILFAIALNIAFFWTRCCVKYNLGQHLCIIRFCHPHFGATRKGRAQIRHFSL